MQVFIGVMLPLLGTALGAGAVYLMPGGQSDKLRRMLVGFAAGVMTAASVWSLLLPAIAQSEQMGSWAFVPATLGFWAGALLLLPLDRWSSRLLGNAALGNTDGATRLMLLAIVIHNLPEGMAVGVAFAGVISGSPGATLAGAMALSLGIALQNIPEGAIVSAPLHAAGQSRIRACLWGVLSGVVEPIGASVTIAAARLLTPVLPYFLSFAAGAMLSVVISELAPDCASGGARGTLLFALGFTLMMALDVALG